MATTGTNNPTGSSENYKVNNIYDLAGNMWDITMERMNSDYRAMRGGAHNYGYGSGGCRLAMGGRSTSVYWTTMGSNTLSKPENGSDNMVASRASLIINVD